MNSDPESDVVECVEEPEDLPELCSAIERENNRFIRFTLYCALGLLAIGGPILIFRHLKKKENVQ